MTTNVDSNVKIDFQVVTCFMEYKGKVLVLQRGRRDDQFGLWGIPSGKLDDQETPRDALSREHLSLDGLNQNVGIILSVSMFDLAPRKRK